MTTTTKTPATPPALREGQFSGFSEDDMKVSAVSGLVSAHREVSRAAQKLAADLDSVAQDPTRTPAQKTEARERLVLQRTHQMRERLERARDGALGAMAAESEVVSKGLRSGLDFGERKELREVLRALPKDERRAALNGALKDGDLLTVAAVLSGPNPTLTSGITGAELAWLREKTTERFFPESAQAIARIEKALDRFNQAFSAIEGWAEKLRPRGGTAVAEAAQKARAAAAAEG